MKKQLPGRVLCFSAFAVMGSVGFITSCRAEKLEIGIQDVISAFLEHNLDLKVEKISPQISEQTVIAEESIFDPIFTAETSGSGTSVDQETSNKDITGYSVSAGVAKQSIIDTVAEAQSTEVEATGQLQTAIIDLHKTVGSTLEKNNINFDGEKT